MKLGDAITRFLDHASQNPSTVHPRHPDNTYKLALFCFGECFSTATTIGDIPPSGLRDFLSRSYVELASGAQQIGLKPSERNISTAGSNASFDSGTEPKQRIPDADDLLGILDEFISWADQQTGGDQVADLAAVVNELRHTLPHALEITRALTGALRNRGGAFTFPEFLTSFEEGGSSQYDIDVPGSVGAIDGYFRIVRVEGSWVEGEELISEEHIWPIIFPSEVAASLEEGYIINLELVRNQMGWQIVGCGFTYPPGTEI